MKTTKNGLTKIEVTEGMNGYPKNLGTGFIGFENIEDAFQFAKENNSQPVLFKRRDGWRFWENAGTKLEELTVWDYLSDLGDCYYKTDEENEKGIIQVILTTFEGEELIAELKKHVEVLEEISKAGEDQSVICYDGAFFETCQNKMMGYHEDVWTYEIGVII